jgi:plastocyanin
MPYSRRRLLGTVGAATATALAGCAGGGSGTETEPPGDIVVGPENRNVFAPAELTVSAGDTVEWYFASPGHNVAAVPEHAPRVSLPEGADPFASYGADGDPNELESQGATYTHTFETSGEYTYVCIPHVRLGMVGTVTVEE